MSIKGSWFARRVDSGMPPRQQQRLASYFDEPLQEESPVKDWYEAVSAPAELSQWVTHGDKIVFVPKGQKPSDKPDDKLFYDKPEKGKGHKKFDDSFWGYDPEKQKKKKKSSPQGEGQPTREKRERTPESQAKHAAWKAISENNKRIIREAKEAGKELQPGSTKHVPWQHWRPSDEGYDDVKASEGKGKHTRKVARIEELKKEIGKTQADALKILENHKVDFKTAGSRYVLDLLLGECQKGLAEYKASKAKILNKESLRISKDDTAAVKKDKRLKRTKAIHEAKFEIVDPEKSKGALIKLEAFTKKAGDHFFAGLDIPSRLVEDDPEKYMVYATVWHAFLSTTKHQILQSMTKQYMTSDGITKRFAEKSMEASEMVKELQKLTHHGKKKRKPRKGAPEYPDHAQLVQWAETHKPK